MCPVNVSLHRINMFYSKPLILQQYELTTKRNHPPCDYSPS